MALEPLRSGGKRPGSWGRALKEPMPDLQLWNASVTNGVRRNGINLGREYEHVYNTQLRGYELYSGKENVVLIRPDKLPFIVDSTHTHPAGTWEASGPDFLKIRGIVGNYGVLDPVPTSRGEF